MPIPGPRSATRSRRIRKTDRSDSLAATLNRERKAWRDFATRNSISCVIGAGINGAAVARDASMRGLKVALVERGDFAGATSSRSSKLIHGGFRYLPQWQFRLVYKRCASANACAIGRRRIWCIRFDFCFRFTGGRGFGRLTMDDGPDAVRHVRADAVVKEWHRVLNAAEVRETEPALSREGSHRRRRCTSTRGLMMRASLSRTCSTRDLHGAAVANYTRGRRVSRSQSTESIVSAQRARSDQRQRRLKFARRNFVNAAGPWVDDIRRMDDPAVEAERALDQGRAPGVSADAFCR